MTEEEILKKHISLMEDGEETLKRFEEWKQCDFAKAVFAAMQECAAQVQSPVADAVTRVEVIDHYSNKGRAYIHGPASDSKVELDYQDGGKTLKIFISKASQTKGGTP